MKSIQLKPVIFLLVVGFALWSFTLHKQYFSLTKIAYKPTEKSLQVTMQLFTDDLEKSLITRFDTPFELNTEREHSDTGTYLSTYIYEHFSLQINGKPMHFIILGKEYIKDETYIYLECKHIRKSIKKVQIFDNMIMEVYPEQQNIVKFNINNQRKSLILDADNPSGELIFNH